MQDDPDRTQSSSPGAGPRRGPSSARPQPPNRADETLAAENVPRDVAAKPPQSQAVGVSSAGARHTAHRSPHQSANQIGPYRLVALLGEGGMGQVFRAEQLEPVRRFVALKVIRLGMDSREVVARFAAERQALALMDHPNVAKVYDAGMTDRGQPYFAMELVDGVPLTQYCDQNRLTTRRRLQLFVEVCHAVQHAHQKGIIHRDLKPGNILVCTVDGKPVPKVIDFGIAKATGESDDLMVTRSGMMMGTLAYMSPEQAAGSLDIDTRTDVYSLGVILYELLTGTLPLDPTALRAAGLDGAIKLIRESEPRKPSTRLGPPRGRTGDPGTLTARTEMAHRRASDFRTIHRELSGDLDWITLKAVEKERTRRYETANGLGADLLRHMNDEPVMARPPTLSYRVGKAARRHKAAVAGIIAVALALVLGLVGTTYGFVRASHERDDLKAAQLALTQQQQRADQAERARKLQQVDALLSASPEAVPALITSVRDLPELVAPPLRRAFEDAAAPPGKKLRAACGLAATTETSPELAEYLIDQVLIAPAAESGNVIQALRAAGPGAIARLKDRVGHSSSDSDTLHQDADKLSRYTFTLLSLGSPGGVDIMLRDRPDPFTRTAFIGSFASWHGELAGAVRYARDCTRAESRSGLCAALGTIDPATLSAADRQAVGDVLSDIYGSAPDGASHSAAGWALRKWGVQLPAIPRANGPAPGRQWFVNSAGMTMVKPPSFVWYPEPNIYRPPGGDPNKRYAITLPQPFWICDRETTIDAFNAFIDDKTIPDYERLQDWPGPDRNIGPTDDCPVHRVTHRDAMMFCNWLSKREGRKPAYAFSLGNIQVNSSVTGYRIPSGAEWECACRAGTDTTFPFGNDVRWLNDYVVIGQIRELPGGSKLPNSWGLFDMLGNVWELTWERYRTSSADDAATIPPDKDISTMRGGSFDGGTVHTRPGSIFPEPIQRRAESVGFRVVCGDAPP